MNKVLEAKEKITAAEQTISAIKAEYVEMFGEEMKD